MAFEELFADLEVLEERIARLVQERDAYAHESERLQSEMQTLHAEREQVRQRVLKLLQRVERLERESAEPSLL